MEQCSRISQDQLDNLPDRITISTLVIPRFQKWIKNVLNGKNSKDDVIWTRQKMPSKISSMLDPNKYKPGKFDPNKYKPGNWIKKKKSTESPSVEERSLGNSLPTIPTFMMAILQFIQLF